MPLASCKVSAREHGSDWRSTFGRKKIEEREQMHGCAYAVAPGGINVSVGTIPDRVLLVVEVFCSVFVSDMAQVVHHGPDHRAKFNFPQSCVVSIVLWHVFLKQGIVSTFIKERKK